MADPDEIPEQTLDSGRQAANRAAGLARAVAGDAFRGGARAPRRVAVGAKLLHRGLRRRGVPLPHFRRRSPVGAPPGTLISHPEAPPPVIRALGYGPEACEEHDLPQVGDLARLRDRYPVLWVNVDGVGDAEVVATVGELFDLHRLALEDVMNVHQRAKAEEYADYMYIVVRMARFQDGQLEDEQVSIFLGRDFVITFQERGGDVLEPVRERLRGGKGRIRTVGADYLAYALLDSIVDAYYPVLEQFGERLEVLEEQAFADPDSALLAEIRQARRQLLGLRHAMWPMREAVSQLHRESTSFVQDENRIYLRDVYDHTVQIIDLLENYREIAMGLQDVYLSSLSHRMNEVMKVLTIIATIFIPLTFLAGIYGMNFNPEASPWNMPELNWYWGYPFIIAFMVLIALMLLGLFRWKRWL